MAGRAFLAYLPAGLSGAAASFISVYAYTHLMKPDEYGWFALAFSTMTLTLMLTATWSEAAAYRFAALARTPEDGLAHRRRVLGLTGASAAAGGLLLAAGAVGLATGSLRTALLSGALVVLLMPFFTALQEIRRAEGKAAAFTGAKTAFDIVATSLGVALAAVSGLGAAAPFLALALASLLMGGLGWAPLARQLAASPARSLPEVRRFAAYGAPLAFAIALNMLLNTGDRFLIAAFLGPEATGAYAAGYGLADRVVTLIFAWTGAAGAPFLLAAWEAGDRVQVREAARRLAHLMLLAGTPAAAGIALIAQPLCAVLIGPELRDEAAGVIPWIALSAWLAGFSMFYFSEAFSLARRTSERMWLTALPACLNLALNLILIPRFGLTGAAIATVAAYGVAFAAMGRRAGRILPMGLPVREAAIAAAGCLAMTVVVPLAPRAGGWGEVLSAMAVGAAVYAAVLIAADAAGARRRIRRWIQHRFRRDLNPPPSTP